MARHLRSTEFAKLLGVSVATVKRWTDSGLLPAERTAGGHRRFSPATVERAATRLAGTDAQLEQWIQHLTGPEGRLAIDAALLTERSRAHGWTPVAEDLGRVLVELGERWQRGQLGVGDEHVASGRLSRALARASDALPVQLGAPRMLLAAVEGEQHTLGLALLELCLRERGWDTVWLGADMPTEALARRVELEEAEALALSASVARDPPSLERAVALLGEPCARTGTALLVGGQGPWPESLPAGELIRELGKLGAWAEAIERGQRRLRVVPARRAGERPPLVAPPRRDLADRFEPGE
jgi:excisionase family DNA binding protein